MELRAKPIPRLRLARIRSSLASYVHFTHPSSSIPSTTTLQHLSSAYNPLLGPFLDSLSLGMPSVRAPLSFCLLPLLLPPHRSISSSPSLPPPLRSIRSTTRRGETPRFKFESSLESTVVSTWFSLRANLTDISFLAWKRNIGKSLIFLGIFLESYDLITRL